MDRGAWQATVHGVAKLDNWALTLTQISENSEEPGWQLILTMTAMYTISSVYRQGNWDLVLSKKSVKSEPDFYI